jgi:curved DNA-binding protein CbpA
LNYTSKQNNYELNCREINRAYEILSDPNLRESYDDYLLHPEENEYYQYYKFYKAKYTPQTDPRLVVLLFLAGFSIFQFISRKKMYENVMQNIEKTPQFHHRVNQQLEEKKKENPNQKIVIIDEDQFNNSD